MNNSELDKERSEITSEVDGIFVSHDVVSLFRHISIMRPFLIIRGRLRTYETLKDRTILPVDDIMDLFKFALTTMHFTFDGTIYIRMFGATMDTVALSSLVTVHRAVTLVL